MGEEYLVDAMWAGAKDGIKLGNQIVQAFTMLLFIVTRPIILTTQILFRKDMGERYFSYPQAIFAFWLIPIATGISVAYSGRWESSFNGYDYDHTLIWDYRTTWSFIIGSAWGAAFLIATGWHFNITLRNRGKAGVLWHSRSDGVPRIPQLTLTIQLVIILAAALLAFWFRLWPFGVLLGLSFIFTYAEDIHAESEFYNRVLDVIDAKLESEWIGQAVEQKLSPGQAHGVNTWLPSRVSDDYRKKVAEYFKKPGEKP